MHLAARSCDPEIVQFLLDQGLNTSAYNNYKETPLMRAADTLSLIRTSNRDNSLADPRLQSFKIFFDNSTNINAQDINGNTALHKLAKHEFDGPAADAMLEAARALLEKGVGLNIRNRNRRTAGEEFVSSDIHGVLRQKATGSDPHRYCYMLLRQTPRPEEHTA